jgi:hypothetical protein
MASKSTAAPSGRLVNLSHRRQIFVFVSIVISLIVFPERGRFFPKPYRDQDIISALQHFVA